MNDETPYRWYRPAKNPGRGSLPGVPLRNLTQAEYEEQPAWLQSSIDAEGSPYQVSAPTAAEKRADTLQIKAWQAQDDAANPAPTEEAEAADAPDIPAELPPPSEE